MKLWRLYHRDREYAREVGDPCLAYIHAPDKESAEREGLDATMGLAPTGVWACEGAPADAIIAGTAVRATAVKTGRWPAREPNIANGKIDSDPPSESPAGSFTREGWIAGARRAARAHGLEPEDPRLRGTLRNALTAPWAQYDLLRESAQALLDACAALKDESRFWCHEPHVRVCPIENLCSICRFAIAVVKLESAVRPADSESGE